MTNIKISIFDLVSFIIPGIVVLIAFTIAINEEIKSLGTMIDLFKKIDFTTSFILTGLAYVIGFATYGVGSYGYRKINKIFWKDPYYNLRETDFNTKISYKWAVIREYSPANFNAINRWAALKGMAQNLTIGLTLLAISTMTKFIKNVFLFEWIIISISCLIMGFLLLNRARVYKKYRENDLKGTLKMIEEKLKKEGKTA